MRFGELPVVKCPVCQKDKAETEMRPLVNVAELKVGEAISDQKIERDVAGTKLQVVCRACWAAILSTKSKEEVMEMMETLVALLMEMERRAAPASVLSEDWVEKMKGGWNPPPLIPSQWGNQPRVYKQPMIPQGPTWIAPQHLIGTDQGTAGGGYTIGTSVVPMGMISKLGDDFQMMVANLK